MLAPGGQLVIPNLIAGQLGFDGATYAVASGEPGSESEPSPEGASRHLGPSHGVLHTPSARPDHELLDHHLRVALADSLAGRFARFAPQGEVEDEPLRARQVRLDLKELDNSPQLSLWERLDVAAALLAGRCGCERINGKHEIDCDGRFDRQAKCHRTRRVKGENIIKRHSSGSYTVQKLVRCGLWTCPICGPQRARSTASALAVAMERHLANDEWSDVWMLTLTVPHGLDDDLEDIVSWLYEASEKFFRSPAWRRFANAHQISGRVRVLDATHGGPSGCHPHFHIALFPTFATLPQWWHGEKRSPFDHNRFERVDDNLVDALVGAIRGANPSAETKPSPLPFKALRLEDEQSRTEYLHELERDLVDAWEKCVEPRTADRTHFRQRGLKLSPSEKASSYFTKWGLADEVGAPTAKSRTHLRLLDAVAAGVDRAGDAFLAFRRAVDGRAWVTGLSDLSKRYDVTADDCKAHRERLREHRRAQLEREGKPEVLVRELELKIRPHLFAGAIALGWAAVFAFIDQVDARGGDVQLELDAYLWTARITARRSQAPP